MCIESWAQCSVTLVPSAWETETGGLLEPRNSWPRQHGKALSHFFLSVNLLAVNEIRKKKQEIYAFFPGSGRNEILPLP